RHRNHVRIAEDLVIAANSNQKMHKAHEFAPDKCAQGPATSTSRHNQMPARRNLQIREREYLPLQLYTRVQFLDGSTFTNGDLFGHAVILSRRASVAQSLFARRPLHDSQSSRRPPSYPVSA